MTRILLSVLLSAWVTLAQAQTITTPVPSQTGTALPGGKTVGRAFAAPIVAGYAASAVTAANRLYAIPFFVGGTSVAKSLSFNITTGNAAAWNARMCIYADNGSGVPSALVPSSDTGTVAIGSGSVTGVQTATMNGATGVALGTGWYWLAFMADNASESVASVTNTSYAVIGFSLLGSSTPANSFANNTTGVFVAQTFGACPSTFGTASYTEAGATPGLVVGF